MMKTVQTIFVLVAVLAVTGGCARYSRSVSTLYEPVVAVRGGSGELQIVMPADQVSRSEKIKWVMGAVKDEDGNRIDEIYSAQSPGELIQNALSQEMRKAGFTVQQVSGNPASAGNMLVLTDPELVLDQVSTAGKLTATCKLRMPVEVWKSGQLLRKLEYNASYSDTSVTDRDVLAREVLRETMHSTMRKAVPELLVILK